MGRELDWEAFCNDLAPAMLTEWGAPDIADRISDDLMRRATSFAASDSSTRSVLRAAFIEEVVGYEPHDAPTDLLATVCLIVRCSLLEEAHAGGAVHDDGIQGLTSAATAPLHRWLSTRDPGSLTENTDAFAVLSERWPRAWAALAALAASTGGGRRPFAMPSAPVPALPEEIERVERGVDDDGRVVLSALDPRFDSAAVNLLESVGPDSALVVSSLSRLSRGLDKMLRMLEIILSRGGSILTTNSLIRPGEVFTRKGGLVPPNSWSPLGPLSETRGLSGIHRKVLVQSLESLSTL